MLPMSFKVLDPSTFLACFKMWTTCMPHSYSKPCIISILNLEIEIATSIVQNSCLPLCLELNYIIHTSRPLSFPYSDPSPTFFFLFFFFGLWVQLQVTNLALLSLFGLKHRLFMNFVRLSTSCALFHLMKIVSSKNLNTKINAPFVMQA